jgi:hypothetical protein
VLMDDWQGNLEKSARLTDRSFVIE